MPGRSAVEKHLLLSKNKVFKLNVQKMAFPRVVDIFGLICIGFILMWRFLRTSKTKLHRAF